MKVVAKLPSSSGRCPSTRYCAAARHYFDKDIADFDIEETGPVIDLGDRLREDLLLVLPAYPHCDRGDDPNRVCPMAGQFEEKDGEPEAGAESKQKSPAIAARKLLVRLRSRSAGNRLTTNGNKLSKR